VHSSRQHHDPDRLNPGFRAVLGAKLDIQHEVVSSFSGREKHRWDQQMSDAKSDQQPTSESRKDADDRRLDVAHVEAAHTSDMDERSIN
jgi:hypothetical protein